MGIMDKIKRATGTDEQYDDIYDNEYYDGFDDYGDAGMDAQTQQVNMNQTQQGYAAPAGTGGMTGSAYPPAAYSPAAGTSAGVFSSSTGGISLSGSAIEMKVVKPEHFESVPQIADHLLNKRTVVLNLENTNKETARRLIDFLSGVAYSIDGSLKKIASNAYVITPSNVDVGDAQLRAGSRPQPPKEETKEERAFGEL